MGNKIFRYKILPDLRLILECWKGEFNFQEILECKNEEATDPEWRDDYNVLADDRYSKKSLRPIVQNISADDEAAFLNQTQNFIKERKSALLASSPEQVATSVLLREHKKRKSIGST